MERTYLDLLARVRDEGRDELNVRTGEVCRVLVGPEIQWDTREGFHALTTKQLMFKSCRGELLGFFRGYTSAADFRALGCPIWDANANVTPGWLANPYRKGEDDLGPIYGKQWTAWKDRRIASSSDERDRLVAKGYKVKMMSDYVHSEDGKHYEWLMEREINQLEEALKKLLTDPSDRRIIVSGWNIAELDMMALPPCHMDYRFVSLAGDQEGPRVLHVVMTMRSTDMYLGLPFNMASTEMFLHVMARLSGHVPGTVTVQLTNAHIYLNHMDKVNQQLAFAPKSLPKLVLSERVQKVTVETVKGAFERIEPDDLVMEGYEFHKWDSRAPMAA